MESSGSSKGSGRGILVLVAVLAISALLGGFWGFLGRLLRAVPKSLRDVVYNFVARNRFRISERYTSCPLPSLAERTKFLA